MIGIAAAIEWIATRGKRISLDYDDRKLEEAAESMIEVLCRIRPEEAAHLVDAVPEKGTAEHVSVPGGIWPNVTAREEAFDDDRYHLTLVGDRDEWGARLSTREGGYTDLRIDASFVLRHWPPGSSGSQPHTARNSSSRSYGTEVSRKAYAEQIIRQAPSVLQHLAIQELFDLVRIRFPDAPREPTRKMARTFLFGDETPMRGRRRKTDPQHYQVLEQFRKKLSSAELQNSTAD